MVGMTRKLSPLEGKRHLQSHRDGFTLEDGSVITVKGNEEIEYDGELHTAANLYDALKEGYYGKF